jgi:hypothetical protein
MFRLRMGQRLVHLGDGELQNVGIGLNRRL